MDLSGRPILGTASDRHLFVNREAELAEVKKAIEAQTNVLILGERGVGRTSLLRMLAMDLDQTGIRPLFLEASLASDAPELLELLRYRIAPQSTFQFKWPLERVPTSARLLEDIREIGRRLNRPTSPQVVLIDEPLSPEVAHTLFGRLRDELWSLPLIWVIAGSLSDRAVYLRPPADAFFPRVIVLQPLDDRASFDLLRARISKSDASDAQLRRIVRAAGGSPRRLVQLANETLLGGRPTHQLAAAERERDALLATLGDSAQRVVEEIEANGPVSASDERFLSRVGLQRSRAAQILRELERQGVLEGVTERVEGRRPRKLYGVAK
jgi:hypothetical protein